MESYIPRPNQAKQWLNQAKPISFNEACARVLDSNAADGARSDVPVLRLNSWAFGSHDGSTMALTRVPLPGREPTLPMALREHAFGQLCKAIGAPPAYIRGLPYKLQQACVNYGMADSQSDGVLRTAGGEVRAIVSDRYATNIDDEFVLATVADMLDRLGLESAAMVRAVATGTSSMLRVTFPNDGVPVKAGDIIEHGFDIVNSELGLSSFSVCPITYRLVCTNGMRGWRSSAAMRFRHVGDRQRLAESVKDAIPVALAEASGQLELWRKAVDTLIDSALDEINSLRGFGLSQADVSHVARVFAFDAHGVQPWEAEPKRLTALAGPCDVYAIANAMTAAAKDKPSIEARLELESRAHQYLRQAV